MEKILELLEKRGMEISRDYEYEHTETPAGRVGVRHDKKEIRAIQLPLTDTEWCSLCMRDREMYMGGCCGQTGQVQDILNAVFRESGWVDANAAESLILVGGSHDGFEILLEKSEEKLIEAEKGWDELDPLRKIFLCVASAVPHMKMKGPRKGQDIDDPNAYEDHRPGHPE